MCVNKCYYKDQTAKALTVKSQQYSNKSEGQCHYYLLQNLLHPVPIIAKQQILSTLCS